MDFYQRLAEPKTPRPALPYKVVIASQPTDDEYSAPDFWAYRAFARACPDHGIPVDTRIPSEVADLAMLAFTTNSETLWEAARQLLKRMTPRVTDNDKDEITVSQDGKELRRWSYANNDERYQKSLIANEFVEGWLQAMASTPT